MLYRGWFWFFAENKGTKPSLEVSVCSISGLGVDVHVYYCNGQNNSSVTASPNRCFVSRVLIGHVGNCERVYSHPNFIALEGPAHF